jgi:rhamnosyltransferase
VNNVQDSYGLSAVIVVYHPNENLIRNISSFFDHIEELYIYKNSALDPELSHKIEEKFGEKLSWLGNEVNDGIGAALNCALIKSLRRGYKLILTMDQDGFFPEDHFGNYLNSIRNNRKFALFSPNQIVAGRPLYGDGEKPLWVMTSGNIIRLDVFDPVELFCEKLFIDGVDIEYCMRLNNLGREFRILYDINLVHELGDIKVFNFFGLKVRLTNHTSIRRYYIFRNYLYIFSEARGSILSYRWSIIRALIGFMLKPILFENDKIQKTKMAILGVWDFYRGKYGSLHDR